MTATPALTKAEKDRLLAAGGQLRASLRQVEGAKKLLTAGQRAELWAWAADLRMVRGLEASTTIARYLDVVRQFFYWVNDEGLDDRELQLADFDRWQRDLFVKRNYSAAWREVITTAVRQFYRWRSEHGLGSNLAEAVRGPKQETRMPTRYSPQQLQRLFGACPPETPIMVRDRAILAFLLATGARRMECAGLTEHQLELRERTCLVRFKGKGAKERDVTFEGEAVQLLKAWLAVRDRMRTTQSPAIWLSFSNRAKGVPVTVGAIEDTVRRAAKRARLRDWGVHRFRVTFASELYDEGWEIEEIRQIMGHESIETTRKYIQTSKRRQRIRMSGATQSRLMGTKPVGMPRWLRQKIGDGADA